MKRNSTTDSGSLFDSVNHQLLLKKLYHYGFLGAVFTLLQSYFNDRRICSKLEGKISNLYNVNSVLGPLLFLLYVNDQPHASKFETTLFADDTNLHLSHNDIDSLQTQAEHETIKINNYVNINKLQEELFHDHGEQKCTGPLRAKPGPGTKIISALPQSDKKW